jgi:hypothetical protein
MNKLIQNISFALNISNSFEKDFISNLQDSDIIWKTNYPIAVVHSKAQFKNKDDADFFQKHHLFDKEGHTPIIYDDKTFKLLLANASSSLKSATLLALKEEPTTTIHYLPKRPNDYWKKIQEVEHIHSSFDFSVFGQEDDICKVEFELREVIRARKEVHALKEVGFIWMAVTDKDVSKVLEHYFGQNYTLVDGKYHIGWSETLKEINMRYFVCPPT